MNQEDVDQVAMIERECFSIPWSEESFRKAVLENDNIYMVATEGERIVAYCGMWGIQGEGNIYNVCVKEEKRGKGIGSDLFGAFLEEGIKAGFSGFTLEVRVSNESAIRLYRKFGFENAGIRKNFYDNPKEDAMVMWKYVH